MKITIFMGPWFPVPAVEGGSVHRFWHGLAENFSSKGHQVKILSKIWVNQPSYQVISGVEYIRRRGFMQSNFLLFNIVKDLIYSFSFSKILPVADIIIVNDFWLPFFAGKSAGKLILNVNRMPKGQIKWYPERAKFIAASFSIKKAIEAQFPKAVNRVLVIPNPIDTEIFYPEFIGKKYNNKIILYTGRIHPEKGLSLLIRSFAILSKKYAGITLRIVGPFEEKQGGAGLQYFNSLKNMCKGLSVEFIGPEFELNKLAQIYRSSNIFCYPSISEKGEAFGVSALEAMASGLVTIVSSLDCFKDFIEDRKTGYIFDHRSKDSAIELSKTLELALYDSDENKAIIENAVKKVSSFSYDKVADSYLAYFNNLLITK